MFGWYHKTTQIMKNFCLIICQKTLSVKLHMINDYNLNQMKYYFYVRYSSLIKISNHTNVYVYPKWETTSNSISPVFVQLKSMTFFVKLTETHQLTLFTCCYVSMGVITQKTRFFTHFCIKSL
jgi:hypothetical protein